MPRDADLAADHARRALIMADFTAAEKLLAFLSKNPAAVPATACYAEPSTQWTLGTALSELRAAFPDFDKTIAGKRVLDYGCGDGFQSVAMAKQGAAFVKGVDISSQRMEHGRKLAGELPNVVFGPSALGPFDVAISLNSFEHFPEPELNLEDIAKAVAPDGKILITFGSPWLSPYGAHMNFFTHFPWVNIVFSEKVVFRVRALYRNDGGSSYYPDMNRMTVRRFEHIIAASGLTLEYCRYDAVRSLPLTRIPVVRELFINRITCILVRK